MCGSANFSRCFKAYRLCLDLTKPVSNVSLTEDVTHSNSAMWFSPDGRYLVFVQSNDTQVKWFPYMWYGENSALYTTVKRIAYPKPGSPNPVVTIKVVDLQNLPPNVTDTPNSTVLLPPAEFQAV